LPLTIAILVVAFGALVAAGLPVLLAFSAVLAATGLNTLASHLVPTDQQTLGAIILMIGARSVMPSLSPRVASRRAGLSRWRWSSFAQPRRLGRRRVARAFHSLTHREISGLRVRGGRSRP
jgi:hypothetical protein